MPASDESPELARQLGLRIRRCRNALSPTTSQERLGQLAGLHRTYIGLVERGEVNLTVYSLVKIAKALGIDPADLVRGLQP